MEDSPFEKVLLVLAIVLFVVLLVLGRNLESPGPYRTTSPLAQDRP